MGAKFVSFCRLFLLIQKNHAKTAFLSKSDAFVNVLMMVVNNFSFIFMWWVIFENKGSINGWSFGEMALLFAVMNNAFAFFALFARGSQTLPEYIGNGSLDNFLTTPRNTLFMISVSESTVANWGDFITGFAMFFLSGYVSWNSFLLMLLSSFCAAIVTYAFRLMVSCLAFWAEDTQRLGDNIFMAFLTFAGQPASIFTGWYKILFLTVIPSGFISLYPVEIIKNFSWSALGWFLLGSFGFLFLSIKVFKFGLRRYTSGNRFGIR